MATGPADTFNQMKAHITDHAFCLTDWDDSTDPEYYFLQSKGGDNYYIIVKVDETNSQIRFSTGYENAATAWTNRATETYQSFEDEF